MNETVEDFKKLHLDNYKKAVLELLKNNSTVLVDEDIMLLFREPPLDSMDSIKSKFLELAKRYKIVLNIENLNTMLSSYRENLIKINDDIKKLRITSLEGLVINFEPKKENDIIKFNKKDFISLNKKMRKMIKDNVITSLDENIVKNVKQLFTENNSLEVIDDMTNAITKYLNKIYTKQLLESVDFKVLVKDTILINGVKEQGERYLFTKNNSHLLNV